MKLIYCDSTLYKKNSLKLTSTKLFCSPIRLMRKKGLVYVYEIKQNLNQKIQPNLIIVCFEITKLDNCIFWNQANFEPKNSSVIIPQKIANIKFDKNFVDNRTFWNRAKLMDQKNSSEFRQNFVDNRKSIKS